MGIQYFYIYTHKFYVFTILTYIFKGIILLLQIFNNKLSSVAIEKTKRKKRITNT